MFRIAFNTQSTKKSRRVFSLHVFALEFTQVFLLSGLCAVSGSATLERALSSLGATFVFVAPLSRNSDDFSLGDFPIKGGCQIVQIGAGPIESSISSP